MENVSQPKVFEFAKEIGMETLALMDKIREWKLPVRSHMAELDPDTMEEIKTRLREEAEKAEGGKKKKTTRSKTATKTTKKAAADGEAAEKPTTTTRKAAAGTKKTVVKKSAAKVVIRRKADEEEQQAQQTSAVEAAAPAEEPAKVVEPTIAEENRNATASAAEESTSQVAEVAPQPVSEAVKEEIAAEPPAVAPAPQATQTQAAAAAASADAASSATEAQPTAPAPSRKREVVMTSQGPTSGIKSETPRRNIVGRMDLSRVQPPTSRHGGPGGGGPGPRGMGPRPLRTGFVAPAPINIIMEEVSEGRRKFDEKRMRAKGGYGGGSGGPKEREEEEQTFLVTEFRKREMVFQPKKKKGLLNREALRTQITTPKASKRIVKVNQSMKLSDLANEIGVKASQLTKVLMSQGVMATMNTELDFDTIALIVPEFGYEAQNVHRTVDQMIEATAFGDLNAEPVPRPPVVTIMGHVDHGKTSLLDAIRKSNVAQGEAGGITQHIGAYQVTTEDGHLITFIDTPGHEAFTAMRARGANVTDIAVIVVAADDGVMPQTIEAVSHAKAAGVPIIVAINKMDKQGANPDRVKQQLTEQELVPEEWGGDTIYVPVSAHTKQGLPELLEQIYLLAEIAELKANPKRSATGVVIESRMDKGRGPVATLLVQEGTLEVGQSIVCGTVSGRVRSLMDYNGKRVEKAGPSMPVEVLGLSDVPLAGDRFDVTVDDKAAEEIAAARKAAAAEAEGKGKVSLEDLFSKLKQGDVKELAMVLKADVAGSAEAIKGMLEKLATDEVRVKLIHSAVGGINESDILLASTAKGIVVGFNVRPDSGAQAAAKRLGVEIKTYTIVYEMMDDLKKALTGLLAPEVVEKELGRAEVRNIFTIPKAGTVAGSFVTEGKIVRNADIRLVREGKIIYTGKIASLKRFKDDAKEVAQGYECGISIENFNDIKVGDVIEAFTKESIVREL